MDSSVPPGRKKKKGREKTTICERLTTFNHNSTICSSRPVNNSLCEEKKQELRWYLFAKLHPYNKA